MTESDTRNWAEKLGYPEGSKVLILHADDAGLNAEANQAIQKYLQHGYIQSASVMTHCNDFKGFTEWASEEKEHDIGLHITLTSEWKDYRWPKKTNDEYPELYYKNEEDKRKNGTFLSSWEEVAFSVEPDALKLEIQNQINRFKEIHDSLPSHLDTHMGVLLNTPGFAKAFLEIGISTGIPVNIPDLPEQFVNKHFEDTKMKMLDFKKPLKNGAGQKREDRIDAIFAEDRIMEFLLKKDEYKLKFPMLDAFLPVPATVKPYTSYHDKKQRFKSFVDNLGGELKWVRNGITELFFHPTVDMLEEDRFMGPDKWRERVHEGHLFADPEIIQFFHDQQINFTNWKEMMRRYKARKKAGKI